MALTELLYQEGRVVNQEGVEVRAVSIGKPRRVYATERHVREFPTSLGSIDPAKTAGADIAFWQRCAEERVANAYTLVPVNPDERDCKGIEIQGERAEEYTLQLYKI